MKWFRLSWNRRVVLVLAVLCFAAVLSDTSFAQLDQWGYWENGVSEPWWFSSKEFTNQDAINAVNRWRTIDADYRATASSEWEGNYFVGSDTHGTYLRWSNRVGFMMAHINKCEARVMGLTSGKARTSPGLIEFSTEVSKMTMQGHHSQAVMPSQLTFLPVTWRGVHYLVPQKQISEFTDYVAGLGKYNFGVGGFIDATEFFAKLGDRDEASAGDLPIVPKGYEHFVKTPIDAKIVRVGSGRRIVSKDDEYWDDFVIPVVVNVGKVQAIKPKMSFIIAGSNGFGKADEIVKIEQVGLRSSRGVIVRPTRKLPCVKIESTDDCKDPDYRSIRVGLKISTRWW